MFIIDEVIKEEYLPRIKRDSSNIIVLKNTVGQDPDIIERIPENTKICVVGGYDWKQDGKYLQQKYKERTIYSPKTLALAIRRMQSVEKQINPNWTQIEKALFVFDKLVKNIEYDYREESKDELRNLTSLTTKKSRCAGFAICYKEMMDRLQIPCDFRNISGVHSFNVLKINNKNIVVDLTWARNNFDAHKPDYLKYFGSFNPRGDIAHIMPFDKTKYAIVGIEKVRKTLENLQETKYESQNAIRKTI